MADDIDIEEHDVLDNPRIKNIFPDLTKIKTEAPDVEDQDNTMDFEYEHINADTHVKCFRDALRFEESELEFPRYNNKIILGRRPCASNDVNLPSISSHRIQPGESSLIFGSHLTQFIKSEQLSDDDMESQVFNHPSPDNTEAQIFDNPSPDDIDAQVFDHPSPDDIEIQVFDHPSPDDSEFQVFDYPSSVIIVGSKPTQERNETHSDEMWVDDPDIRDIRIPLERWGPRLERSMCYCKDCQILFSTRNCLDSHKASVHSFLVALDTNRAVKSTTKGPDLRNIARKRTGPLNEPSTSKATFCNHCNKEFPDHDALIAHIYTIFPKCDVCDADFKTKAELQAHVVEAHDNLLTDFGSDNYYKCNVCTCYFRYKGTFARHMLKNHGQKVSEFHLKLPFQGQCLFCRYIGNNKKNYNHHLKIYHKKLYLEKGNFAKAVRTKPLLEPTKVKFPQNVLEPSKFSKNTVRSSKSLQKTVTRIFYVYQCTLCHEILPSYYSAKQHKNKKHLGFRNHRLFNKVPVRKNVPMTLAQEVLKPPVKRPDIKTHTVIEGLVNPPVPKDILFKCNHCQIHFTNCSTAVVHSRNCLKYKGNWKCQKCKRNFNFSDSTVHQHQHEVSERFNVYLVDETLYGRVLCQCPHCDFYFYEKEFWAHFKTGCRPAKLVNCKTCDLPIHVSSINEHNKWHKNPKNASKEAILVQFVIIANNEDDTAIATPSKRKIREESDYVPSKKAKLCYNSKRRSAMVMYYCIHCRCCIRGTKYISYHYNGQCENSSKVPTICKVCGLLTASQRHKKQHSTDRGIKIANFEFVRIQDDKTINAPMPDYPRCRKCDVRFISTVASEKHDCTDNSKTCRYCKHKFSDLAYKLHIPFHEYRPPTFNIKANELGGQVSMNPKKLAIPQKSATLKTPVIDQQLLKNYLLLTNTWNMLYLCQICDIACDSYDKMVEHSQNHFSNMESYDITVKSCQICDLKFDSTCFDKHRELHRRNKALKKDSFDIFTYNYVYLLTDDWFKLFGDLPKTQIERIVSQSIYKYSLTVKMRVITESDGPPIDTIYQCAQCKKYVNPLTLAKHYSYASCAIDVRKYHCSICDIYFASVTGRNHHAIAHENKNTSAQSFRTVLINETGDEEFNAAMRIESVKKRVVSPVKKATSGPKRSYIYYQCKACKCCIKLVDKMKLHECSVGKTYKKPCPKCGLLFRSTKLHRHEMLHKTLPGFERKNMKIIRFEPRNPRHKLTKQTDLFVRTDSSAVEKVAKIYKCRCGLHFVSSKTVDKHLEVCSPEYKTSKENCSKCGLLFPTDALVSHSCSHHSNDKYSRFEIEEIDSVQNAERDTPKIDNIKGVFKCTKCDLYFLSRYTIKYHFRLNHKANNTLQCDFCGLKFIAASLKRHVDYHHTKFKCDLKDIRITAFDAGFNIQLDDSKINSQSKDSPKRLQYKLSTKSLSKIDKKLYSKNLYKCLSCAVHFLRKPNLSKHLSTEAHRLRDTSAIIKCDICRLAFSYKALHKHKYIHHEKFKLSRKQFNIIAPYDNQMVNSEEAIASKDTSTLLQQQHYKKDIYICVKCDVHFINKSGLQKHLYNHELRVKLAIACTECGLKFTPWSLKHHVYVHHQMSSLRREDFCIKTLDNSETEHSGRDPDEDEELIELPDEHSIEADLSDKGKAGEECYESNKTDNWYERLLYRCEKCTVNFLTLNSLENHKEKRQHGLPKRECDTCHLMFTKQTLYKHKEIQHEKLDLKLEDLWIVSRMHSSPKHTAVDSLIFSEYLYKCDKCSIHLFTRRTFDEHVIDCDGEATKTKCIVCDFVFSKRSISKHFKIHHEILKLQNEEFHVVKQARRSATAQYYSLKDVNNAQKDTTVAKASANSEENIYIDDDEDEMTIELSENTPSKLSENKTGETSANVLSLKPLYRNYLYKCRICSVHFMSENSIRNHIALNRHSSPTTSCSYCGLEFSSGNVARHKQIHHFKMKLLFKDFKIIEVPSVGDATVINVLLKCSFCHLHFVSESGYDEHTCEPDADFVVTNKGRCSKCSLSFHLKALQRHKYLHHQKMNFRREDFVIVVPRKDENETDTGTVIQDHNYSPNLEKLKLPEKYKSSPRTFSMTEKYKSIINISFYNEYLYKCVKCNLHFITGKSLTKHVYRCVAVPLSRVKCSSCGLWFSAHSLAKHEYIHHEKLGLKFEDFQIFNETETKATKNKVSDVEVESVDNMEGDDNSSINTHNDECSVDLGNEINVTNASTARTLIERKNEPDPKKSNKLRSYTLSATFKASVKLSLFSDTLYKCGMCSLHYLDSVSLDKHISSCDGSIKNIKDCPVCGLAFTFITVEKHMYIHHEKLRFKCEDIKVVSRIRSAASERFNNSYLNNTIEQVIPKSSTNETANVVSQDPTNLENYTSISESTILQSDTDNLTISLDESNVDAIAISASTSNKLPSPKSRLINNSEKNTSKPIVVVSESTSSGDIESSIDKISSSKELVKNDATFETKYKVKLYKCSECNVYFMTQSTCYKHTIKHQPLHNLEYIDCKICGLAFRILSLHKHISAHHKNEFKLEDVLIEEYQPNMQSKGIPKINIYYALDKVQSRLVSTTTEISGKDIDTTDINQSNNQDEIVTNVPKNHTNTEEVTNSQEIVKRNSNTDTIPESATICHDDNNKIVTESIVDTSKNTDKIQVTEKVMHLDVTESQSKSTENKEDSVTFTEITSKSVVNVDKNRVIVIEVNDKTCAADLFSAYLYKDKVTEKVSIENGTEPISKDDTHKYEVSEKDNNVEVNGPISTVCSDKEKYTAKVIDIDIDKETFIENTDVKVTEKINIDDINKPITVLNVDQVTER